MSETRRREALRRLGGPVCPVCDGVGADLKVEVRWVTDFGQDWLKQRGKGSTIKEKLAPMCQKCFLLMNNAEVAKRAEDQERAAAAERQRQQQEVEWLVRQDPRHGQMYRAAVAEHQGDLEAAEELAAEWGVGNGLFGSRGD